jgi:phosphohistidine phosphatase
MKYLTVVRHAKSSWSQPGLADHDRPLNDRGRRAAAAMARFLWTTYLGGERSEPLMPPPARLVSSTAVRALSTAQVMRETFQMPTEHLLLDQGLYLAQESRLLKAAREWDESWGHVMLFGHNPGLHDFVNRLLARAGVQRFPTCSVALMALPVEFWALTDWNEAQLLGLLTPKMLERRFPDVYQGISGQDDD